MKRTRWLVSMVTERGVTFREIGWSERLPVGSASGAVASPMQAASNARAGITRKLRETASLRASLKVYVIVQAFRRPPYRGTQPFPLTTATLGLRLIYGFSAAISMINMCTTGCYVTSSDLHKLVWLQEIRVMSQLDCNKNSV